MQQAAIAAEHLLNLKPICLLKDGLASLLQKEKKKDVA
jgi:hypothetical protein